MKKRNQKYLYISIGLLAAFVVWTVLVKFVEVRAVYDAVPEVGFATINKAFHDLTGMHWWVYYVTDFISIIPFGFVFGFAFLGLFQWIKRKNLFKVDYNLFVLGGFYIIVLAAYAFFEVVVINSRPVLIEGVIETSYPSSTTMLAMCVFPTAIMQLDARIKNKAFKLSVDIALAILTAFMVIGRLVCGVHWLTDIIGGALLSSGLVVMYYYFSKLKSK